MLYIRFSAAEHSARTQIVDDQRIVDFGADGSLYGVEFIGTTEGLDLTGLHERDRIEAAIKAIPQFHVAN